jgi:hypothetical protein
VRRQACNTGRGAAKAIAENESQVIQTKLRMTPNY